MERQGSGEREKERERENESDRKILSNGNTHTQEKK